MNTTESSFTTTIASPGTRQSFTAFATYASKSRRGACRAERDAGAASPAATARVSQERIGRRAGLRSDGPVMSRRLGEGGGVAVCRTSYPPPQAAAPHPPDVAPPGRRRYRSGALTPALPNERFPLAPRMAQSEERRVGKE